jgi:hypothetical protein
VSVRTVDVAEHFVGDRTGLVLKECAVFGQHREVSEAIVPCHDHLMRRVKAALRGSFDVRYSLKATDYWGTANCR